MDGFSEIVLLVHHIWQACVRNIKQIDIRLNVALFEKSGTYVFKGCDLGFLGLLRNAIHHRLGNFARDRVFDGGVDVGFGGLLMGA